MVYSARLGRFIVLNSEFFRRKHIKALARYDEDGDIVRITVFPSYHAKPQIGSHYFLYFPTLTKAAGHHPFSLSGWVDPNAARSPLPASSPAVASAFDKELATTAERDYPSTHASEEKTPYWP